MSYSIESITESIGARRVGNVPATIDWLLTDSRSLNFPEETLFFALTTKRNDGARYIADLYARGVRNFVLSEESFRLIEHGELKIDNDAQQPAIHFQSSTVNYLIVSNPLKALQKLAEEDPTFRVHTDPETSQTIISGMGELHLDIIDDRLLREFKVGCTVGNPQVAYRETIRKAVKSEGKFVRQSGGKGQYGHCWLEITPRKPGEGFLFENKVVGGAIPKEYIAPIEAGVKEAMENGVVAGYPMVDIAVTVYDGSYHEVDSSEMAFKIAGSMGFKSGAEKANPVILEPYMKVEITDPEEYMGDVIGDVNSRRGRIEGMEARNGAQVINAFVPLAEMFGYATDLRSKTQGRGNYSMEVDHYEDVPRNIAEAIIAKNKGTN